MENLATQKERIERSYAVTGWAISKGGFTIQELNELSKDQIIQVADLYEQWLAQQLV